MSVEILQLCPLIPAMEQSLNEQYKVHRWFEIADQNAFLNAHADKVKGVVTGGHIGIPNELADRLPALEIVAINGVGFDKVDLPKARQRGYGVSNTPDVLTTDVADTAIGLIIAQARHIASADAHVRKEIGQSRNRAWHTRQWAAVWDLWLGSYRQGNCPAAGGL